MKLVQIALILVVGITGFRISLAAESRDMAIINACTPQEKWVAKGNKVPKWFSSGNDFSSKDFEVAFHPFQVAYLKSTNSAAFDYLMGRAYFQVGLIDFAFLYFQKQLFQKDPNAKIFKNAAIECLTHLQTENASLKINPDLIPALLSSWKDAIEVYKNYFTLLVLRNQLSLKVFPKEIVPNSNDQTMPAMASSLMKAAAGEVNEAVVRQLQIVTQESRSKYTSAIYRPYFDLAKLNLSRALFMEGKFEESITVSLQILKKFPSMPENIELLAWSNFMQKKWNASNAQAFTLRTPGLKNYFSPQTTLIPAIIFMDHCQYEEAKKQLDYFRVKYRLEHEYFSKFSSDRYSDFISTLNEKTPKKVPAKIMSEWLKSPVITSLLEENNLILDERAKFTEFKTFVVKRVSHKDNMLQGFKKLLEEAKDLQLKLNQIEAKNIIDIRNALNSKVEFLKEQLEQATQDAAFMEVDVLVALSNTISKVNGVNPESSANEDVGSVKKTKKIPEWNWGKTVSGYLENEEIWSDEMGHFKVDVKDQCKTKK